MDAPKDVNPYAPMPASSEAASARVVPRWFAIVAAVLAYPLPGAGLLVLRRRPRDLVWAGAGLVLWSILALGTRSRVGLLAGVVLMLVWLAGLIVAGIAAAPEPRTWGRAVVVALVSIAAAKGVGAASKALVIEAFQIPAGSMIPALLIGDHIFVDKRAHQPARGDVIVFHYPKDPKTDYVKRVIGLPGETIEIRGGELLVDGHALERRELEEPCPDQLGCTVWEETAGTHRYRTLHGRRRMSDYGPEAVPPGGYFVLGDNRDNSNDSRVWGSVPTELVVGVATSIWYSRDPMPGGVVRWSRFGKLIE